MATGWSTLVTLERAESQPWGFQVDRRGQICGLWLEDVAVAKNKERLKMILAMEKAAGRAVTLEMFASIDLGAYDVLADPEGVTLWWAVPARRAPWWQFWQ
jgi:hypothetical protein